ncbi:unnamed protein product [Urochloa humidicola]
MRSWHMCPLVHGALHAIMDDCYSTTIVDQSFLCRIARNEYCCTDSGRSSARCQAHGR